MDSPASCCLRPPWGSQASPDPRWACSCPSAARRRAAGLGADTGCVCPRAPAPPPQGWAGSRGEHRPSAAPLPRRRPGHGRYFHPFSSCRKTPSLLPLLTEAAAGSSAEGWEIPWPGCPSSDTRHPRAEGSWACVEPPIHWTTPCNPGFLHSAPHRICRDVGDALMGRELSSCLSARPAARRGPGSHPGTSAPLGDGAERCKCCSLVPTAHLSARHCPYQRADALCVTGNGRIPLPGRRRWQRAACPAAARPQRLGVAGTSHPTSRLTTAARGWSEQHGLGRARALQGSTITPFLLCPREVMNTHPDPHPGAARTSTCRRGAGSRRRRAPLPPGRWIPAIPLGEGTHPRLFSPHSG